MHRLLEVENLFDGFYVSLYMWYILWGHIVTVLHKVADALASFWIQDGFTLSVIVCVYCSVFIWQICGAQVTYWCMWMRRAFWASRIMIWWACSSPSLQRRLSRWRCAVVTHFLLILMTPIQKWSQLLLWMLQVRSCIVRRFQFAFAWEGELGKTWNSWARHVNSVW